MVALSLAVCLAALIVGGGLSLGIVWYERCAMPEAKRTLINRLIAFQCLCAAVANVVVAAINVPGQALGLLGPAHCDGLLLASRVGIWTWMLTADAIVALRCVFTCRFKKVLACNDDLLFKAIITVLGALPTYFAVLLWFSGKRFTRTYYVCLSQKPDDSVGAGPVVVGVTLASIVLHIAVALVIFVSQRRAEAAAGPAVANMTKDSLVTLVTSLGIFFAMAGSLVAVIVASGASEAGGSGDAWPPVYGMVLVSVFIPGVYYAKNKDMAEKVSHMYLGKLAGR